MTALDLAQKLLIFSPPESLQNLKIPDFVELFWSDKITYQRKQQISAVILWVARITITAYTMIKIDNSFQVIR